MGDSIQLVAVDMHLDLLAKCLIRTIALKEFTPVDPRAASRDLKNARVGLASYIHCKFEQSIGRPGQDAESREPGYCLPWTLAWYAL